MSPFVTSARLSTRERNGEGEDAMRLPPIVGGGHLTPVKSIKKMVLHAHRVAPLQTFANNGMNSPSAGRRLFLFPPDKVMQHFLHRQTDKQTDWQTCCIKTNRLHNGKKELKMDWFYHWIITARFCVFAGSGFFPMQQKLMTIKL